MLGQSDRFWERRHQGGSFGETIEAIGLSRPCAISFCYSFRSINGGACGKTICGYANLTDLFPDAELISC